MNSLQKKKASFEIDWKALGIKDLAFEALSNLMKENNARIENMEASRNESKNET